LRKTDIDTPAIVVDLSVMERNIDTMVHFVKSKNIRLRPHFKTPKTPAIAWKEIRAGANGVCCQKLGEAEVCAMAGIDDILITNEVVEAQKIDRLIGLTKHVQDLKVNVDNPINVRALSEAARSKNTKLGVVAELEVGQERCGVVPGKDTLSLVKQISESPGLVFRGIQGYAGHLMTLDQREGFEKKRLECERVNTLLVNTKDMIEDAGIHVEMMTGAGTGTYKLQYEALSEVQCGSFPLMDWTYNVSAPEFDIAMIVLATVISTPLSTRVVTDCGWKTISTDHGQPKIRGRDDLEYRTKGDEHGVVSSARGPIGLNLGDKIELHTSHVCTTINLHDRIYGVRDNEIEVIWPILARGRSQ